jgi:very-short-patch-repair endonuclease
MAQPITLLARRARTQHGLITDRQAHECGVSKAALARWTDGGRLEHLLPTVYRLAGAPDSWEQSVMAATLSSDGTASHRAAARFWELGDYLEVELTVPRSRRGTVPGRRRGVIVHRSGDIEARFTTRRAGVPVTNPMRTLVDLGAVVAEAQVADAVERALIARVCSAAAIERTLDDVARRGRRGAGVIRRVMDERALGHARPDGLLEARMARLLRERGLPAPHFQFHVRRHGRLIARVDFAYPDIRLAIEVDGFEVHGTPSAFQHDVERQNRLMAAGWTVLRFTWRDVVSRPDWVVAQISELLRDRACA